MASSLPLSFLSSPTISSNNSIISSKTNSNISSKTLLNFSSYPLHQSIIHSDISPNTFPSSKTPPAISRNPFVVSCLTVPTPPTTATPNSETSVPLRIAFAAGGTGGHIYPAIAIAEALKSSNPTTQFLFLGSPHSLESSLVPSANFPFLPVPQTRLNPLLPFQIIRSIFASWRILCDFRPHLVVGTGGYVSAPVCLAAILSRIPIVIQEQNSYPGLSNKLLAPFAEKIFLAFNACVKYLDKRKCLVFGNPVRGSVTRVVPKAVAVSHFFTRIGGRGLENAEVVLVLGGSGGANAINIAVLNMYYDMLLEHKNRFIIWQTGADGFGEMESLVRSNRRLLLTPFLHEMDLAYAAADVVVSRAGAMTCTEILVTGKPSILIPLSTAANDHQTKNAYIMADVAGSKVLTEDELDSSSLEDAINGVLGNKEVMEDMSQRALKVARPDAAAKIAEHILSLVKIPARN